MKDIAELKNHVYDIVGALHSVHDELGPGINEFCYQEALAMELSNRGIPFEREKTFHPCYKGRTMSAEYRIDFLCKGDVIVETGWLIDGRNHDSGTRCCSFSRLRRRAVGVRPVNQPPSLLNVKPCRF